MLLTDFNMHWLHSELQAIIYTDISLSAHINLLTCLSLSLHSLCSSSSFCLASSCFLSSHFCSKLLKIQVTLLNNLSRKSFGRSHQLAYSGLRNHIPCPQLYLPVPSSLPPLLLPIYLFFTEMSRNFLCKTLIHCASILCKRINFVLNLNMKYIHSLRSSAPLTEKVTKFNMNINLIEQG